MSDRTVGASFRDPSGVLVAVEGRIFRLVNAGGESDLEAFLSSPAAGKIIRQGRIVRSRVVDPEEFSRLRSNPALSAIFSSVHPCRILEHERIPFASFPYEWPPEMLHAAGLLTLDIAKELISEDLGLKDGTPYNVLFRGSEPVFIDVLSFERRRRGDPTWLPYAQFVRNFVLPLLANKYFGLALDQMLACRSDGIEPEQVFQWLSPLEKLRPPFLTLVSIPKWLGGRQKGENEDLYKTKSLDNPDKARFIVGSLLSGLRRVLNRLEPKAGRHSTWSGYMASNHHYSEAGFSVKHDFITEILSEFKPRRVLDIGANTGHFSLLAAENGASVVAVDYDPVVVGALWRTAVARKLDILPLVVDLTRPSPGTGWRNREWPSFLERARLSFDAVLMLAVIHHMLVTARVPLGEVIELAAELTTDVAIIEFVAPDDPMFRRLTRGRDALHADLTIEQFESVCTRHFEIQRCRTLEGSSRRLYLLRKKR